MIKPDPSAHTYLRLKGLIKFFC